MKKFTKILLLLTATGLASMGITTTALAYTNPELLQLVEKIAEYGLKGYIEYLNFLLDLFKEAVKALV